MAQQYSSGYPDHQGHQAVGAQQYAAREQLQVQDQMNQLAVEFEKKYDSILKKHDLSGIAFRFHNAALTDADLKAIEKITAAALKQEYYDKGKLPPPNLPQILFHQYAPQRRSNAPEASGQNRRISGPQQAVRGEVAKVAAAGLMTYQAVPEEYRNHSENFLRASLFPLIEQHRANPPMAVDVLMECIFRQPQQIIASLFLNLSAQGRALPTDLHLVGDALLKMASKDPHFARWAHIQGNGKRLQWLKENVQYTYATGLAPDFIRNFLANQRDGIPPELSQEKKVQLDEYFRNSPGVITNIALLLSQARLTPALQILAAFIIRPLRSNTPLPDDMSCSLKALERKLQRINPGAFPKPVKAPRVKNGVDQDAIATMIEPPAPPARVLPEDDTEIERIRPLQGLQDTAANVLADIMTRKYQMTKEQHWRECQKVVLDYIAPAMETQGQKLSIDPDKGFEVLGVGGMSLVVKAWDTFLNQFIALRFDIFGLTSPENSELSLRGIATHSKLGVHPNIVRSDGFGIIKVKVSLPGAKNIEVGMLFQRQELLNGGKGLDDIITENPGVPTPRQFLDTMIQATRALDYAHGMGEEDGMGGRKGIVHRDIKPDNIMVMPNGRVKLLDWGLARDNTTAQAGASLAQGGILGTLAYLAPEVLANPEASREKSGDIYGLATTAFEFASGQKKVHPAEQSYLSKGFSREGNERQYSQVAMIQPGQGPIIRRDNSLLEAFQRPENKSEQFIAQLIIQECMERASDPDPAKRPTTGELLDFMETAQEALELFGHLEDPDQIRAHIRIRTPYKLGELPEIGSASTEPVSKPRARTTGELRRRSQAAKEAPEEKPGMLRKITRFLPDGVRGMLGL